MIVRKEKFINKGFEYKSLSQLKKEYNCKDIPSPSKIIAYEDKGIAFMNSALKDENHPFNKTIKESLSNGRNVHNMFDKNSLDKEKYSNEQNELYQAVQEEFQSKIEPLISEVWAQEKGLLIPNQYGGKFDSVGKFQGEDMVWDYKKINKRKTKSQIKNYLLQTASYIKAHNFMYGTKINKLGVFTIYGKEADKVGSEIFIIEGKEINDYFTLFETKLKNYKINEQI